MRKEWKTLNKMNNPVFVGGLKPYQWIVVFMVFFFFLFALLVGDSPYRFIILLLPYPIYQGIKKVGKENDAGHPDYLSSLFVWVQLNKHFLDSTNVFSKMKKKSERAGTKI